MTAAAHAPRHPVPPPPRQTFATLVRHQLGAGAATVMDFSTMIGAVRLLGLPPTVGTAMGASLGALVNFTLSRRWIFAVSLEPAEAPERAAAPAGPARALHHQAMRYGLVSLGSLLLNVALVWLLHDRAGIHYVLSRLLGAVAVSLLWNFPMHRHFVFG